MWARHIARAEVREGRKIVPGAGHVFFYTRLKVKPYVGSHNRSYTQLYLHVRRLSDLPVGRSVKLPDSAVAVSGFMAVQWPNDFSDISGTVTRLSADTLSPKLDLRLQYTVRDSRRALRRRLVFQHDTAYFRRKK
ncbi:hypothetical protein EJV47_20420 [Hymenobacter gummosus]|uniref:Uncharacterized protein n=1 Tax=Hymenobacter gummosus TaxID=1776032 RepID=A0A431TXM9_9BACT|nr:hypothetical protein [Hymenobacter gummosus]RTQ46742.1 hypothetical protein EJV47_20420 [Hymenobacter gummosus]